MKKEDLLNEYGMTAGAPTPVSSQRTGGLTTSASPTARATQTRPPLSQSPSKLKSLSPSTDTPASPTAKRGSLNKTPSLVALKAQDVPVNSVIKNKAGKVVGTVVEPIQKTPNKPLPPGKPGGPKSDAVVIKDPRGKYKVVKGRDALIVDDPRVQQESATVAKLALENIVTVNNRNYGNSLRLANIENLPLEEQLSLMDLVDGDMLNEAHSIAEAFDAPYPYEWDADSATDSYAYANLPDGAWLKVSFDHGEEDDDVDVSFVRNGTTDISGEGDAYRIFATVMATIREYIAMYSPSQITFSALKEIHTTDDNYDDIVKSGASRIKLYNRMVNTFAAKMGYTASTYDSKSKIIYHLIKTAPAKTDRITEAFDTPYPFTWGNEENDYGDWDAVTRLPDGSPLHVMFSYNESDDFTTLEFYRNNGQDVSGEGDAYRIFATVMAAVQQYVKKINPSAIVFSATKEEAPDGDASSRTKLYNRMVMKYAGQMGYEANIYDRQDAVDYQLVRTAPATADRITEGAVPDNDRVRTINKLLARPFPANDIKAQMDAFFAIPDPAMIKAFRQARAQNGDNTSLHPVLRTFVKSLHPAIQKSIKLYEQPPKGK